MKVFLLSILFTISTLCFSQDQINVKNLNPDHEYENVLTKTLYSDSKSTYFIIWIKKDVKSHKHEKHTESIIVIAGEADMILGNKKMKIKEGDYFVIPENTFHSVKVTSKIPLKVISVQTPEFLGNDRIFEEN
ncbi:MAG: cupin domain-containing protein [Flavobacteriales bacterium]|nr:cupin domain-containing protein [Flavobacteriales bacterium]MCB9173915.1 cupin domain-containing protein [Flavobacteriales bacterium]